MYAAIPAILLAACLVAAAASLAAIVAAFRTRSRPAIARLAQRLSRVLIAVAALLVIGFIAYNALGVAAIKATAPELREAVLTAHLGRLGLKRDLGILFAALLGLVLVRVRIGAVE